MADLDDLISRHFKSGDDSEFCIDFENNSGTLKFKLPVEMDPNAWIENINLFGGIVRCAHELTAIQEKTEDQRTENDTKMLKCFEILQTVVGDDQKNKN